MQAHEFTCQLCGDTETTLHVHHKQYIKGREPWEYEPDQLITVCEECHAASHDHEDTLNLVASYLPLDGPKSRDSMAFLVAGFADVALPVSDADYDHESAMIGILAERLLGGWHRKWLEKLFMASQTREGIERMQEALMAAAARPE